MRPIALLLAASMAAVPLLALAPTASAFDWCTSATHETCQHVVCIGRSSGWYGQERCSIGVPRDPCDIFTCGPGPVLP